MRPVVDAGPGLTFLAANAERLPSWLRQCNASPSCPWPSDSPTRSTWLERAAGSEHLPNRQAMRDLYGRMRFLDDGLVHIDQTRLLSRAVWESHQGG